MFTRTFRSRGFVPVGPPALFAQLDDHAVLSSHMGRSSWMMGGGRMDAELDDGGFRRRGSVLRMHGRVFGLALEVEEVVTEYEPPSRKAWDTVGEPRLLVIGAYRMAFGIEAWKGGSMLTVSIDYALPTRGLSRWLGKLLGAWYARWCTRRMVADAQRSAQSRDG